MARQQPSKPATPAPEFSLGPRPAPGSRPGCWCSTCRPDPRPVSPVVQRLFAELARRDVERDTDGVHREGGKPRPEHAPPWRDRLSDGTLGPERGPTPDRYAELVQQYRDQFEGWHPWDHRRVRDPHLERYAARMAGQLKQRWDHVPISAYVERHSADIPTQELRAFVLFWLDLASYQKLASVLKISGKSANNLVQKLRKRAEGDPPRTQGEGT